MEEDVRAGQTRWCLCTYGNCCNKVKEPDGRCYFHTPEKIAEKYHNAQKLLDLKNEVRRKREEIVITALNMYELYDKKFDNETMAEVVSDYLKAKRKLDEFRR